MEMYLAIKENNNLKEKTMKFLFYNYKEIIFSTINTIILCKTE
jgi:hypothetical protein